MINVEEIEAVKQFADDVITYSELSSKIEEKLGIVLNRGQLKYRMKLAFGKDYLEKRKEMTERYYFRKELASDILDAYATYSIPHTSFCGEKEKTLLKSFENNVKCDVVEDWGMDGIDYFIKVEVGRLFWNSVGGNIENDDEFDEFEEGEKEKLGPFYWLETFVAHNLPLMDARVLPANAIHNPLKLVYILCERDIIYISYTFREDCKPELVYNL